MWILTRKLILVPIGVTDHQTAGRRVEAWEEDGGIIGAGAVFIKYINISVHPISKTFSSCEI